MKNKNGILSGIIVLILVCLAACLGSCSKTKNSTEPTPPVTSKTLSFTQTGTPSDNSIYLEQVSVNNDEITLAVKIKGGNDIFGTAIEINFEGSKVSYVSATEDSYLNQGGAVITSFLPALEQGSTGVLLIGINLQGNASGVSGDGTLCRIVLKVLAEQTDTSIHFNTVNSSLYDSGKISKGNTWISGSLSYN